MGDEKHYATATEEFDGGQADAALKAKAYVQADGKDHRVKLEYIKLRVAQLSKQNGSNSLEHWYESLSVNQRTVAALIACLLVPLFGVGLVPLIALIWLELRARTKHETEDLGR